MKLSEETLTIINNFKLLNPGLVVKAGSKIKTVSAKSSMPIAIANVEETFPVDFAIADLHRFLTVFNLLDNPELEFVENSIKMTDDSNKSALIRCAATTMVKHFDYSKSIKLPSTDVEFKLTANDFKSLKKAADYFLSPEIAFVGEGGKVRGTTYNSENRGSDKFSIDLNVETEHNFEIVVETAYLSIIPQAYDVAISFKGLLEFKGVGEKSSVMYYIGASDKSKVY